MRKSKFKKGHGKDLYYKTMERNPMFIKYITDDILKFSEYNEYDIAFGSGISLENIRKLLAGKIDHVDRKMFQELIHFYSRTICGWCAYRYKDKEFDYYSN